MKINVLGTEYTIKEVDSNYSVKFENADGWCDTSTKEIFVRKFEPDDDSKENLDYVRRKIIRHELIHAFIYESGLDTESHWALNEVVVDFFAIQTPKLAKVFEEIKVI